MRPNAPHSSRSRNPLPPLPDISATVKPQVVPPEAELPDAIAALGREVETLGYVVGGLLERLRPILRPLPNGADGIDAEYANPPQADLTNRIGDIRGMVHHITAILDNGRGALAI